jgi:tetratricopeptide (TPR) repeat protein
VSWQVARLEEIEEVSDGRCPWRPVRDHFGIGSFGVNSFTGNAIGDRIINEHDEADEQEELYVVVSGRARFEFDGETVDAPTGTYLFATPGVLRTAFAEEPQTTLLAIGGTPGQPYQGPPPGWQEWLPLAPLYDAGEYEAVIERAREILADDPPYPTVNYNLACCESLTGRKDDALRHLRRAIEIWDGMREYARNDTDLDAIRGEPAFAEIVG